MKIHLAGSSLVWSSKGLVSVKDLQENDEILVVSSFSKIGNYRLKTKPEFFGPSAMTRIYTENNVIEVPQYSKIATSDMQLKKANEFSDSDHIYFLTKKQCQQISAFTNMLENKEFSSDVAWCLGASEPSRKTNSVKFRFKNVEKMNRFRDFLMKNIKPQFYGKIQYKTTNYTIGSFYLDDVSFVIKYDSKKILKILSEFSLKRDTIPQILQKNSYDFFEKFLYGIIGFETDTSLVQCVEMTGSRDQKTKALLLDRDSYVSRFFQNMSLISGKFVLWNNPELLTGKNISYKQKLALLLYLPSRPKPEFLNVIHVEKKIMLPTYELEIDDETRPIIDNLAIFPEEINIMKLQDQLDKERLKLLERKYVDERKKRPTDISKIRRGYANSEFLKTISQIGERTSSVYVIGFIREKTKVQKKQTKKGETVDFAEAVLEDDTGKMPIKLWANFASMFKNGDCVVLEDGFSSKFLDESYLTTGIRGNLKKI